VVPLSKTNDAYVSFRNTRIISVLPSVTKLMERIIFNKMKNKLYGAEGIIDSA
jgi:hypothetical protein